MKFNRVAKWVKLFQASLVPEVKVPFISTIKNITPLTVGALQPGWMNSPSKRSKAVNKYLVL